VLRKVESSIFHGFWNLAFHSPWMLDVFTRHSTGVAADRWRLYYRDFGKIEVNVPPLGVAHVVEREFNDLADAHAKTIAKHAAERQLHASLRNALLRGQTP
jgi:hypothetical protein